jgi:hypothetical protein
LEEHTLFPTAEMMLSLLTELLPKNPQEYDKTPPKLGKSAGHVPKKARTSLR